MLRARLDCAGDASQVSVARHFIRQALAAWGAERYEWTTEALVSELATNAVIHARTDFTVTVSFDGRCVVLDVADASPLPPVRRRFESTATTGRGMRLVDDLSTSWSVAIDGNTKVITCTITEADAGGRLSVPPSAVDTAALLARFGADDHMANEHSTNEHSTNDDDTKDTGAQDNRATDGRGVAGAGVPRITGPARGWRDAA